MTTAYLEVAEWKRFQHYKDRDPPWIKLHRMLLDNYEWARLQDASKAHLVGIWLLAGRHGNRVPADPEWIANRIGASAPVNLEVLAAAGFITIHETVEQDASSALANRTPEAEAERETTSPPSARAKPPFTHTDQQRARTLARFDLDDRLSVEDYLTLIPEDRRSAWVALLDAWTENRDVPPTPKLIPPDIAAGLRAYLADCPPEKRTFNPKHVLGYCRDVARKRLEPPEPAKRTNGSAPADATALDEFRGVLTAIGAAGGPRNLPREVYEGLSAGGKAAWREVGGASALANMSERERPFMERRWCQAYRSAA